MIKQALTALRMLAILSLITGAAYPALMLAVGGALFPAQTSGSLLYRNGVVLGSALVGQRFSGDGYFWPRPSASNYSALPSSASTLGPTSAALLRAVAERKEHAGKGAGGEMLFASGSGLDPDISPQSALAQIPRILKARKMAQDGGQRLEALVEQCTQAYDLGFLGEKRVNVLRLNLTLDDLTKEQAHD